MKTATYRTFEAAARATSWTRYRDNACVVEWPDGKFRVHLRDVNGKPCVYGPSFGEAKEWQPVRWWAGGWMPVERTTA